MKKYLDLIINISYLFILNICFNIIIFKTISFLTIFYLFLSSLAIASFIKLIADLFKKELVRKIINIVFVSLVSIIFIAQMVHYYFYSCFFSFYSFTKSGQVFGFIGQIIKTISNNFLSISLLFILLISFIIVSIKVKHLREKTKSIIMIILITVSISMFILCIQLDRNKTYSSYNLTNEINNSTLNFEKFGLPFGEIVDFYRYFNPVDTEFTEIDNSNEVYSKEKYNIADINFNKKTNDIYIKNLNNYFKNREPSNKNEYTGIFKNKNLIFITAESFDFNIIDKDLTPTLYKLKEEGLFFNNFYTPIYYASTSDGEYINLTGTLPKEGVWSFIESKNNSYPYSYANIFNNMNYKTYAYHNGTHTFYDRNTVMPGFGFKTFKACGENLNISCDLWPQSDYEMFNTSFKDYKNEDKFVSYYMTISGHLSHNFTSNDMAIKWKNKVNSLKYTETVKSYISANIDLDRGLENLLANLKDENILDDTVIVLVPDHFPYGLSKKEIRELQTIKNDYDIHKTGLIIYNSETKSKKINKLSSNLDILPTLLNMYGVQYDSRLIVGNDIMSNKRGIVMFNDQSFLVDEGFYNTKTDKFNGEICGIDEERLITEVKNKFSASNVIINKNYYKYLFK